MNEEAIGEDHGPTVTVKGMAPQCACSLSPHLCIFVCLCYSCKIDKFFISKFGCPTLLLGTSKMLSGHNHAVK